MWVVCINLLLDNSSAVPFRFFCNIRLSQLYISDFIWFFSANVEVQIIDRLV